MNLLDIFKASSLNKYYGKVKENTLAEAMFPAKYNNSFDLNVLNSMEGGTVRVIQHSNLDADPMFRDWNLKTHTKEGKKFFREGMRLNEEQRMTLLQIMQSQDKELAENFIAQIYDEFAGKNGFLASVRSLAAYTISQLLSTGKVTYIDENGGGYEADYRLSPSFKETLTSTHTWDKPTADPLEDLNRWREIVEEKNGKVEIALMSKKTFGYLKKSAVILNSLKTQQLRASEENIRKEIKEMTELDVVVWKDKVNVDGTPKNIFPDNIVTLIPNGKLGEMEYGPTPTKVDKLFGLAGDRDIVDITGTFAPLEVAAVSKNGTTVNNVDIIIEAMVAPNPKIMNSMFIATVV